MKAKLTLAWVLTVCVTITWAAAHGQYYSKTVPYSPMKEQVTNLHFFFHDILGGKNPSAVLVAKANNTTIGDKSPTPFSTVFAVDDPLTAGPELTSEVIGNCQGLYASTGQDNLSLVVYFDFGFTKGEFNGSAISVFSRNPVLETERELAVVGGRGKFRMARGFAQLKTFSVNQTNGDAIVEYNVTVFHY